MHSRIAWIAGLAGFVLIAALMAIRVVSPSSDAEARAWAYLAPDLTVHRCTAPPAETYAARDVHWLHKSPGGIAMATPSEFGTNALVGDDRPVGTLVWTPEGCEVVPLEWQTVQVTIENVGGEPISAALSACPWMPIQQVAGGSATVQIPVGARCRLLAVAHDDQTFQQSGPVSLERDTTNIKLVVGGPQHNIEDRKSANKAFLAFMEKPQGGGPYDARIDAAPDAAIRSVLEGWRDDYELRKRKTLALLTSIAERDDGWIQLSR